MIIKNATQVGNPIIRKISKAVQRKNIKSKKVQKIIKNLVDSMHHHELVGMAAPQVGINLKIFVNEIRETQLRKSFSKKEKSELHIFINPQIIFSSKKRVRGYEGCGSVASAQLFCSVSRPQAVTVRALDEKGEPFVLKARGLLAKVIQHEQDHLDGKIFLDRLTDPASLMSRNEYLKKFQKKKK